MIFKEISAKAFVSKLAIEAFESGILPRAAFFSKLVAYAMFLNELFKGEASELRTLISSDNSGDTTESEAFLNDFYNHLSGNAKTYLNTQREPAEEVFNRHYFNISAVCKESNGHKRGQT